MRRKDLRKLPLYTQGLTCGKMAIPKQCKTLSGVEGYYGRFSTCRGRVLALAAELGDREGVAEVAAALADDADWLQLLHGGRARDGGFCSRHNRKGRLSEFQV